MSLYSWNVIATVAEHHSISQAANILNLTPSAVSHMVKKVEDGVDTPFLSASATTLSLPAAVKRSSPIYRII